MSNLQENAEMQILPEMSIRAKIVSISTSTKDSIAIVSELRDPTSSMEN